MREEKKDENKKVSLSIAGKKTGDEFLLPVVGDFAQMLDVSLFDLFNVLKFILGETRCESSV